MDIIIYTLISGLAVAYTVELLTSIIPFQWFDRILKRFGTLPLAAFGCWVFDIQGLSLIICSCAASFVALFVVFFVNRPTVITNNSNRR